MVVRLLSCCERIAPIDVSDGSESDVSDASNCTKTEPIDVSAGRLSADGPGCGPPPAPNGLAALSVRLVAVVNAGNEMVASGATCSKSRPPASWRDVSVSVVNVLVRKISKLPPTCVSAGAEMVAGPGPCVICPCCVTMVASTRKPDDNDVSDGRLSGPSAGMPTML